MGTKVPPLLRFLLWECFLKISYCAEVSPITMFISTVVSPQFSLHFPNNETELPQTQERQRESLLVITLLALKDTAYDGLWC